MSADVTADDWMIAGQIVTLYAGDPIHLAERFAKGLAQQRVEIAAKYEAVATTLVALAESYEGTVLTGTNAYLHAASRIREVSP